MRKKHDSKGTNLGSVKLYRNDMEEITHILEEAGCKVTFSDKESEYDSLNEVETVRGPRLNNLQIVGSLPQFRIKPAKTKNTVRCLWT